MLYVCSKQFTIFDTHKFHGQIRTLYQFYFKPNGQTVNKNSFRKFRQKKNCEDEKQSGSLGRLKLRRHMLSQQSSKINSLCHYSKLQVKMTAAVT